MYLEIDLEWCVTYENVGISRVILRMINRLGAQHRMHTSFTADENATTPAHMPAICIIKIKTVCVNIEKLFIVC